MDDHHLILDLWILACFILISFVQDTLENQISISRGVPSQGIKYSLFLWDNFERTTLMFGDARGQMA